MQLFPSFFGSEHAQCAMQRRLKRERNYYGERLGSGRSDTASVQTLAYDTLEAPMMQLFVLCVFVLRFFSCFASAARSWMQLRASRLLPRSWYSSMLCVRYHAHFAFHGHLGTVARLRLRGPPLPVPSYRPCS
jgi:hypothetical protein